MQLSDYVTIIRRYWWAIVLTAFAAAAAAYIFSKLTTPVFRAEASYGVTPSRFDNGLNIVLQQSMNRFRDDALAPIQLEQISSNLQIDRNADWLLQRVRIQAQPDNSKMIVQVDYPDDQGTAVRLAQAVGDNMVAQVGALNARTDSTDKIYMSVQQPARAIGRVRPTTMINVAAGGILGLIIGLLLAFVLFSLDNSLKTAADVERYVGLTMLGAIPSVTDHRRSANNDRRGMDSLRQLLKRNT